MATEDELPSIKTRNKPEFLHQDEAFAAIASKLETQTIEFSDKEQEILDLYDALQELRLENAMMEAQITGADDLGPNDDAKELEDAEREHLEACASYALTNSIVKNVLQADPILKAVHAGENASPMERSLHPLIDERDVLSLVQTNLSKHLTQVRNDLVFVQTRNLGVTTRNRVLSKDIVELGKQTEVTADKIDDPAMKQRLEELRSQAREEKRQYRIIKSLASGIVAGSGFDWAADEKLRDIVLDDED